MINTDSLVDAVDQLFALLETREVEFVLVGGVALLQYVDGRNTQDIDLIVAISTLAALPEIRIIEQDMFFARGLFGSLQIDFLLAEHPLFAIICQDYTTVRRFAERDIPTASVEGLLLLKLYALPSLYRQGNFAKVGIYENDVATLIHYYQSDIEALCQVLARHLSASDLHEINGILAEIQRRLQRFDSKGGAAA